MNQNFRQSTGYHNSTRKPFNYGTNGNTVNFKLLTSIPRPLGDEAERLQRNNQKWELTTSQQEILQ